MQTEKLTIAQLVERGLMAKVHTNNDAFLYKPTKPLLIQSAISKEYLYVDHILNDLVDREYMECLVLKDCDAEILCEGTVYTVQIVSAIKLYSRSLSGNNSAYKEVTNWNVMQSYGMFGKLKFDNPCNYIDFAITECGDTGLVIIVSNKPNELIVKDSQNCTEYKIVGRPITYPQDWNELLTKTGTK